MFESAILSLELPTWRVPSASTLANATASCGPALWPPVAAKAAPPRPPARTRTSAASRKRLGLVMIDLPSWGDDNESLPHEPSSDPIPMVASLLRPTTTPTERADGGDRTRDPQLGKLMLYRLSYVRVRFILAPLSRGHEPRRRRAVSSRCSGSTL